MPPLPDVLPLRAEPAASCAVRQAVCAGAGPDTGTVTTPETETITREATDDESDLDQPWHVIVFNDPVNLMQFVTKVIMRVFGYPEEQAERMMMDVHTQGKCIVWTGPREQAEMYVQQLQSWQLLSSMKKAG